MTSTRPGGPLLIALLALALVGAACGQPDLGKGSLAAPNVETQAEDGSASTTSAAFTATAITPASVSSDGQEDVDDAQPVVVVGSDSDSDESTDSTGSDGSAVDAASSTTVSSTGSDGSTSSVTGPQATSTVPADPDAPTTTASTASTAAPTTSAAPTTTAAPRSTTAAPTSSEIERIPGCATSGGSSGAEGLKQWCWSDLAQEIGGAGAQSSFSSSQLAKSVHYNPDGVFVRGGRLHFSLNPTTPPSGSTHYRQEIRDNPANVRHPLGTEQWWGFDYRFGDDYVADELPWILWQTHGYFSSPSNPMTALEVAPSNYQRNGNPAGELFVSNSAISTGSPKKARLGIVPRAGQTLNVVIQLVWGDNSTGLFRVWIDGALVYDEQERTVYVEEPEGGYWKIGIYKWRWQDQSNVDGSASRGIDELNTSIGPLRVIKRSPSNASYLANEYNTVKP